MDEKLSESLKGVSRVKFYLEESEAGRSELARLSVQLPEHELRTVTVCDEDWENNWKAYYKPVPIGDRLLIVPEWENADSEERTVLRLDPGLIFGTGQHPTTKMCLRLIEKYAADTECALDLGCGSGILSIAAILLGAKSAVGCDIDPKAPKVAMENGALNGIGEDRLAVYAGDILSDTKLQKKLDCRKYKLILANIVADVIIALAPTVPGRLAENGTFICSGIIDGREDEVRAALEKAGLAVAGHYTEDGWNCFECTAADAE